MTAPHIHSSLETSVRRLLYGLGVAIVFTVLTPGAPRAATPSPVDWRDVPVYQICTDRFFDGNPSNNNAEGSYDPGSATGPPAGWSSGNVHGGDFAGIVEKLDYIQALGFRAVWISPVQLNVDGVYHGYAARNFQAIAPHFGTEAELHALADALHARGMYLILDVVCNHMGNLIGSNTAGYPAFRANPSPYVLSWRGAARPAAPFDNLSWYHNNGEIQNFVDPDQVLGELAGLDDLKTEDATVRAALVGAFSWLITATDADGFRIDSVKHAELGFWQAWTPAVRAHAASLGKSNFLFCGEVLDGSDVKNGLYTGTQGGGAYALNSVLYFPMHFNMKDVFAHGQGTSLLNDRYAQLSAYDPTSRESLLHFLDNHDVARFLSEVPNQDPALLRVALVFLLTTRGIPVVYQGTEQGFDGGADPYDREDMWDGEWEFGPSVGDNFNMTHPLYQHVRFLLDVRARYEALRTGAFTALAASSSEGIYAFRRDGPEDVLVAVNTADGTRSTGPLLTRWAPGTVIKDLRTPAIKITVSAGGTASFTVPARDSRIFVRTSALTSESPAVETQSPAHAASVGTLRPSILLEWTRHMDVPTVSPAFHLDPGTAGALSWQGDSIMIFTPGVDLALGARYRVRVDPSAQAVGGTPLRAAFETFFDTPGGVPGLSVAVGYQGIALASGGALGTPEGIAAGTSGPWIGDLFIGDALGNRILRLGYEGALTVHAQGGSLDKPEGLDFDRSGTWGGDLLVADSGGLLRVSGAGAVSTLASGTPATSTGAIVCSHPGPLGGFPYLGSHALDRVERFQSGTGFSSFATPVRGFEGVTEASGGFGTNALLVSNPNLTAYVASIDGDGSILRVSTTGVLSVQVAAGRLPGATALVVDELGAFGGDLLVADVVTESVLRVTPGGTISVLASGFGNLFGSDCLALGPDGALYVVDTGSGEPLTDSSGGTATARVVRIAPVQGVVATPDPVLPVVQLRVVPQPFRSSGHVQFSIPRAGRVSLLLFDLAGRRVTSVFQGDLPEGASEIPLRLPARLASGVYFLRLEGPGVVVAARVIVL